MLTLRRHRLLLLLSCCLWASMAAPHPDTFTADPDLPADARLVDVELSGLFPFLESQVRPQITLRSGGLYRAEQLQEQIGRLHDYYTRKGYFDSWFNTHSRWDSNSQGVVVKVRAHRGHSLRWGSIVAPNTVLTPGRIRSAFPDMMTYTPQRIRDGVRKLAQVLRNRGYIRARVSVAEQRPDFASGRMHLTLHVDTGPLVTVAFRGNLALASSTLRKSLTFASEGRLDYFEVDASIAKLQAAYLQRGFPSAAIRVDRETIDPEHIAVTFHITEGPRQTIWDVQLDGNRALNTRTLASSVLTQQLAFGQRGVLDPKVLIEDERALREQYHNAGFLDAVIGPTEVTQYPRPGFLRVRIPISEGPQYIVGKIALQGNRAISESTLLSVITLLPGVRLHSNLLASDQDAVQLYYADHGYPYATVQQRIAPIPNTSTYLITYAITEGPPVRVGAINMTGDFLTSQRAIRQAFGVTEGAPYSDGAIRDGLARLRRLGTFRAVTVEQPGLAQGADRVDLTLRIEEERPYQIDFDLGYSTRDLVTGTMRFTNINTFGWAKRTQLLLTGGLKRTRGELAWIDPWFFGTDLVHTVTAWIDRTQQPAYDLIQSGGGTSLVRQYHRTGYLVRYQMTQNRLLNGDATKAADEGYRDTVMSQLTAGITFDTRNNFANPERGGYLFAQTDLFNELRGQRADYLRIGTGASRYLPLGHGAVLSGHLRAGGIVKFHDATIPITDRFFLGGEDTIRGFNEDAIGPTSADGTPSGGLMRWIGNIELSAPLGQSLRVATFADMGALTDTIGAINARTIRSSAGVGLRYTTPIGPIRLDYGYKLDRQPGESADRFHFTFGHVF